MIPRGIVEIYPATVDPTTHAPVLNALYDTETSATTHICDFSVYTTGQVTTVGQDPICCIIGANGAVNLLGSNCIVVIPKAITETP